MTARRFALVALVLFSLSACSGPPWTLARSADGITLRWYPDDTSDLTAQAVAAGYCAQMAKRASLHDIMQDGSVNVAHYRCA